MFGDIVKHGDFDRLLLRPRSTVLQLFGHELTLRRLGPLPAGRGGAAVRHRPLDIAWSADRMALLVLTVAGGVCLFIGLIILQATSAFWTTESLEVWNAFTYGGVTMSQYPLGHLSPVVPPVLHVRDPAGVRQLLPRRRDSGTPRSARHVDRLSTAGAARRAALPADRAASLEDRRPALSIDRKLRSTSDAKLRPPRPICLDSRRAMLVAYVSKVEATKVEAS